jgi:hypothetical protein
MRILKSYTLPHILLGSPNEAGRDEQGIWYAWEIPEKHTEFKLVELKGTRDYLGDLGINGR